MVYNAVAVRGEMTEFLITTRQGVDAVIKRAVWRGSPCKFEDAKDLTVQFEGRT